MRLLPLALIAFGVALRLNTLVVVVAAGLMSGLQAGMSWHEVVELLGRLFIDNRYMTLPIVLMVPVIGLLERHGLRERAEALIGRAHAATAGRVLLVYAGVRQLSIALGVNIGGHAAMVRPLVVPMAEAAARARHGELSPEASESLRAHAACAENVGNFFGEDIFVAVGAVLLMKGFFDANGIVVSVWELALWGIPTALAAFAALAWRTRLLDRALSRAARRDEEQPPR